MDEVVGPMVLRVSRIRRGCGTNFARLMLRGVKEWWAAWAGEPTSDAVGRGRGSEKQVRPLSDSLKTPNRRLEMLCS